MKRLLSPLLIVLSLFVGTSVAVAAIKVMTTTVFIVMETGSGPVVLTSVSGLGYTGKGPPKAKGATPAVPTPVDVRFNADPNSEGMKRAIGFLAGQTSMDASIKLLDHSFAVKQTVSLGTSSIVEMEIPGADAVEAKGYADFRFRLQPKFLTTQTGSGSVAMTVGSKTKGILTSNFRVSIDDVPETGATAVLPTVVRRVGKELQISGLGVTILQAQATSGQWQKWAETELVNGEGEKSSEKSLKVEFLDATLKTVLLTIEYTGVGLEGLKIADLEPNSDSSARATFRMYARAVSIK